jgi:MerR family transcriptional regulator, light-induced transcriptional regulator
MNILPEARTSDEGSSRLSISAMERETGLSKDTLRVWERRYGFPMPTRDGFGERLYSADQLDKLKVMCRLIDSGYRPGKIVNLSLGHLESLAEQAVATSSNQAPTFLNHEDLELMLDLCKTHQVDELRRLLSQASLRMGLERFVIDLVSPLTIKVGEAWARGHLEIFEEHLYTESIQVVLRNAISNIPVIGHGPRFLLTTFPIEPHGLGLLMAEAVLALHGAKCFSLGTQTPILEIVRAAKVQGINAVALSFSSYLNPNQVGEGLAALRQQLPANVEIWAGGLASVLQRKPPDGVKVVTSLADIPAALVNWRYSHAFAERASTAA